MEETRNLHVPEALPEAYTQQREYVDLLGQPVARSGNPAAEWRLRKQRQNAIDERLHKLGPLAALSGSSLLVLLQGNQVPKLERFSNWRTTLKESPLYQKLPPIPRGQLTGARRGPYCRVEDSIQLLGEMICLVVRDLCQEDLLYAYNEFKFRCASFAFASDKTNDETVEMVKWIGKACQAVLLGTIVPEEPESDLSLWKGDILLPFAGELTYISEAIRAGKRQQSLNHKQATQLAQIGNLPRSLPYPSKDKMTEAIKQTVDIIQTRTSTPEEAIRLYRRGLAAMRETIPKLSTKKTHVSLLGSGTVESSRSDGGRARYLVAHARATTDIPLQDAKDLVGKYDQFGLMILNPITFDLAIEHCHSKEWKPLLGTLMYVPGYEVETVLTNHFIEGRKIPKYLGHILNLTASNLIQAVGRFEPEPEKLCNTIAFRERVCKFRLEKTLYVKADVSIESGLKTRMTTSALAAFAHLSQLPANYMREYLGQDPFHRVGFEEADKLWEVLKTYRRQTE